MKDPMQVLQVKEQELLKVRKEIDALQLVARLLSEDTALQGETKLVEAKAVEPRIIGSKQDLRQLIEMP